MRAALIQQCGAPPSVGKRDVPVPGADQVAVRVTAASITPLDVLCASGTSYFGAPATPYVPGVQGVGTLDDGTAVWFATPAGMRPGDGSMAEMAVVPRRDVVTLPDDVDHRLIAALGLSAVAALMALTWRGGMQAGEQVLVLGGGGVVGQAAIQLALLGGARRVIAACRSEAAQSRARAVGATAVVPLADAGGPATQTDTTSPLADGGPATRADTTGPVDDGGVAARADTTGPVADGGVAALTARLTEAADGPVDLVLDPVFGVPAAAALRTLRPGGRLVNLGSAAGETAPFESATLRGRSLNVLGYTNNDLTAEQRADAIGVIAGHVRAGRLTVDYEQVALAAVGEAWDRQAAGRAGRRLVVVP
ncbi:zinc-binding alcohol dehydrogenase family protein [Wangella sp. NEAU-J3]|nr:zinc-binding alcohol dehydrogenase family protein [Jidongwangia harbinensis]